MIASILLLCQPQRRTRDVANCSLCPGWAKKCTYLCSQKDDDKSLVCWPSTRAHTVEPAELMSSHNAAASILRKWRLAISGVSVDGINAFSIRAVQ